MNQKISNLERKKSLLKKVNDYNRVSMGVNESVFLKKLNKSGNSILHVLIEFEDYLRTPNISDRFDLNFSDIEKLFDEALNLGADLECQNKSQDQTPLMYALSKNCPPAFFDYLLSKGACVDPPLSKKGLSPLFLSLGSLHPFYAIKLLDSGADANRKTSKGLPPLLIAATCAPELVLPLLKAGAHQSINQVSSSGESALHYAIKNNPQIIEFLMEAGADVHLKNKLGETPLDLMIEMSKLGSNKSLETYQKWRALTHQKNLERELPVAHSSSNLKKRV